MNNEQFERRMEFIVEQQAQFAVDIQQLKETQEAESKLWRQKYGDLTDALTTVVGMIGKLAESQERTDEQLSELTAKQAETDDRLNAFINVVERYFSGNGRKPSPKRRASKAKTLGRAKRSGKK